MSQTDRETPRSIAIVGLIMLLLVVLGYVALGVVMKLDGYPKEEFGIKWTPLALNLRQHGHWFLALPLLWVICGVAAAHIDRGAAIAHIASAICGILLVVIFMLFLFAVGNPYTRPLMIAIPKEKSLDTQPKAEQAPVQGQSR
jgi:hypothetical protein